MHHTIVHLVAAVGRARHVVVQDRRHARQTPTHRITGLRAVAERAVRACGIVGRVHDPVVGLVAGVDGAVHAVGQRGRDARDTPPRDVTHLRAVAEERVVAPCADGQVVDPVCLLVAHVLRASHAVVGHGRSPREASTLGVAGLAARAEETVVTRGVDRLVGHLARDGVAAVDRTVDAVIDLRCVPGLTIEGHIAALEAAAGEVVVAPCVDGRMNHAVGLLVAQVLRTRHGVVELGRRPGSAPELQVTDLFPVAERPVIAARVHAHVHDSVAELVTRVVGAVEAVVGDGGDARQATGGGVAQLGPVAKEAIVTGARLWCVDDTALDLAARVLSAPHAIVDGDGLPGSAVGHRVADLGAVAEEAVLAGCVIRKMLNEIKGIIAPIVGAGDPIVEHRRHPGDAPFVRSADLEAVAESAVVAACVARGVRDLARGLVAGVEGARYTVVDDGRGARQTVAGLDLTDLGAVAEQAVVAVHVGVARRPGLAPLAQAAQLARGAQGVVWQRSALADRVVAGVGRAVERVVAHDRLSRSAGALDAVLAAVAHGAVVAVVVVAAPDGQEAADLRIADLAHGAACVVDLHEARVRVLVAQVRRALDVVRARQPRRREARPALTTLYPVAEEAVVALELPLALTRVRIRAADAAARAGHVDRAARGIQADRPIQEGRRVQIRVQVDPAGAIADAEAPVEPFARAPTRALAALAARARLTASARPHGPGDRDPSFRRPHMTPDCPAAAP